jgi:hypothetical protein
MLEAALEMGRAAGVPDAKMKEVLRKMVGWNYREHKKRRCLK